MLWEDVAKQKLFILMGIQVLKVLFLLESATQAFIAVVTKIQDYTHELWRGKLTPASVNFPDHMALARSSGSQDHGGGLVVSKAEALETDPRDGSSSSFLLLRQAKLFSTCIKALALLLSRMHRLCS